MEAVDSATDMVTELVTDPSCSESGPSMVAFLWTILMIAIQWWAWPIVLHMSKGPRSILKAISWSCSTSTQPGAAGYFAIQASRTHEERLVLFFNGMPIHGAKENETKMSWKTIFFYLGCKIASMVPFVLGLANRFIFCGKSDKGDEVSQSIASLALQIWYFPSIPGAIIGIWLVLDVKVFRLTRTWSVTICYLLLFLGGVLLFAACFVANKRAGNKTSATPLLPSLAYFAMCWWSGARGKSGSFVAAIYSILARNLPIALVAFGLSYYPFPWPALEHPAFGAWFMIMGVVCAGLGWYGFAMKGGPVELLKERKSQRYGRRAERKIEREVEILDVEDVPVVGKYQPVSTIDIRGV
jgi:hypothetical protein